MELRIKGGEWSLPWPVRGRARLSGHVVSAFGISVFFLAGSCYIAGRVCFQEMNWARELEEVVGIPSFLRRPRVRI